MSETTEHAFAAPASSPASSHVPAWRGHGTVPVNLVLEGGAMRGQFTAGVLDFFMDQKLFCERVIGVSAGALCGYNYVAGEDGRTCYLNTKYCDDWRYLSMKSFVRTGNACGREHLARTAPRGEEVHENGTLRIKHLGLEIGRRNDLAHVKASFVGAARISHPRQFLFASYCKRVCSTVHQIVTVRSMNLDIPDIFAR